MSHFLGFDPEWAAGPKWSLSTVHSRIDDLWWLFDNVWKFSIVFSLKVINMGMDQYLLIPFLGEWTSIYQLFWCELQGYKVLTHCHMYLYCPISWSDSRWCFKANLLIRSPCLLAHLWFPKAVHYLFCYSLFCQIEMASTLKSSLFFSGLRWIEHFNFWLKSTCLSMLRKSQGAVWPAASYAGAKAAIERGRCREHCFWTPDRCRLRQLAGYSLVGRG